MTACVVCYNRMRVMEIVKRSSEEDLIEMILDYENIRTYKDTYIEQLKQENIALKKRYEQTKNKKK